MEDLSSKTKKNSSRARDAALAAALPVGNENDENPTVSLFGLL